MTKTYLFLCITIILGCQDSKSKLDPTNIESSRRTELINIMVFQDGQFQVNGQKITESSLESHLGNLPIGENTKARIYLDENAWFGSVSNITSMLLKHEINGTNISSKVYDSETFSKLGKEILVVDILNNNSAQVNGNYIHTSDLILALNSYKETATQVWFSISEKATVGPVFDIQTNAYHLGYDLTFL